jgi:hypothetical protein
MTHFDDERDRHREHRAFDPRDDREAVPGRATLTARLPASAEAIARAVAAGLRATSSDPAPDVAARGVASGGGPLPYLDVIQRAFGHHDVGGVRAHVGGAASDAAAQLGARAYAAGDAVAFTADPDLHLAAHEATHVVQQRGGVRLSGTMGRSDDDYERHADRVADAVVRGESVEALLDPLAHRGARGGSATIQRDPTEAIRALHALGDHPSAQQIAGVVRSHASDARVILDEVRRTDPALAMSAEMEVTSTSPEMQYALQLAPPNAPQQPAQPSQPRPQNPLTAPTPAPARAPTAATPTVERHGNEVTATTSPDRNTRLSATARQSGANRAPQLGDIRFTVEGRSDNARGRLGATYDPQEQRAGFEAGGKIRTGRGQPILRGQGSASVAPGPNGPDAQASGQVSVQLNAGDFSLLVQGGVLISSGQDAVFNVSVRAEGILANLGRIRGLSRDAETRIRGFVGASYSSDGQGQVNAGANF